KYIQWARLCLPSLQIACCAWKVNEHASTAECVRRSRNVKFALGASFHIGEVQFYFRSKHTGVERAYALVSVWSEPNQQLFEESSQAVYACAYCGQDSLQVIEVKTILSVVGMVLMQPSLGDRSPRFFLIDKPGLIILMTVDVNNENDEE
ncbi:hypothetical protein EI94DRAFT_1618096, partial [Lactarius quietus]